MLPGYRGSKRCHFPFVSANEQRGTPMVTVVQGQMRPFDNIMESGMFLYWTVAWTRVGKAVFRIIVEAD